MTDVGTTIVFVFRRWKITSKLYDLQAMKLKYTVSFIRLKCLAVTAKPGTKMLIKYNSNSLEDEEEKELINIELNERRAVHENNENCIEFRLSDKHREEKDITQINLV